MEKETAQPEDLIFIETFTLSTASGAVAVIDSEDYAYTISLDPNSPGA